MIAEAGASTVSSYRLNGNGTARVISASLTVGQGAACWVVVTADGRFACAPATPPARSRATRSSVTAH